jgi:hypothetical protein
MELLGPVSYLGVAGIGRNRRSKGSVTVARVATVAIAGTVA